MIRILGARLSASLVAVTIILLGVHSVVAQDDDRTPRIGVVDLQRILQKSVAAEKVRVEIESRQTQYRQDIGARENALREQQQELERQRTILSPEAFTEREREFTKAVEALQREVGVRNRQLEESLAYGMQRVQVETLKIIARIADELALGLVLDKSQLLLMATDLEFSEQALEQLNAEVTSVPTTPPVE